jgi:hypothetical protein
MKKIYILLTVNMIALATYCQSPSADHTDSTFNELQQSVNPNYGKYNGQPLDSNNQYKQIKEGLVMQGGQLKIVRNGSLFVMHGPFPLKNGAMIYTNGIINMPDGSTPVLDEKDFIDFDGRIRPLQNAAANNMVSLTNPLF